jgi:hypothetical protein
LLSRGENFFDWGRKGLQLAKLGNNCVCAIEQTITLFYAMTALLSAAAKMRDYSDALLRAFGATPQNRGSYTLDHDDHGVC